MSITAGADSRTHISAADSCTAAERVPLEPLLAVLFDVLERDAEARALGYCCDADRRAA